MGWADVFGELGLVIASRDALLGAGATGRSLTSAVRNGHLLRARRDHYALPATQRTVIRSVRIGGRIACLSALAHAGVFALDSAATHAHVEPGTSRTRHPDRPHARLGRERGGVVVHWNELLDREDGTEFSVGIRDALAQVVRCEPPRSAIASIDNALFLGVIDSAGIGEIFAHLPEGKQHLRPRIDGRAEAGQETVLRLALIDAGLCCEPQVTLPGVGRVDLVVEGCLVVEADSRLAHDGWERHVRDRDRDINAALQGYPTLRPAYRRTMEATGDVVEAALGLLRASRHFRSYV